MNKLEIVLINRCVFHIKTLKNKDKLIKIPDEVKKTNRLYGNPVIAWTLGIQPNEIENNYDKSPRQFNEDLAYLLSLEMTTASTSTSMPTTATTDTDTVTSETKEVTAPEKLTYRQILAKHGYASVGKIRNTTAGDLLKIFAENFVDLEEKSSLANNCANNIVEENREILSKEFGTTDLTKVNIYKKELQSKYEEIRFGVFYKKTRLGGNVLIKLPKGCQVDMRGLKGLDYHRVPRLLGFATTLNMPTQKSIGVYLNEEMPEGENYTCVVFTMIDSLRDFASNKANAYLYADYEAFCEGKEPVAESFSKLTEYDKGLGHEIALGVTAEGTEKLLIDGVNNAGCLVLGGPGSGKTTLMDTLLIQALNLDNKEYRVGNKTGSGEGNGAIVIVDNKTSEWTGGWRPAFNSVGKDLYGFDGSSISPSLLVYAKKGVKTSIEGDIPKYIGGAYFLTDIRGIIRDIFQQAGVNKVSKFNNGDFNIDGITRIPRIVSLVDEFNSLASTTYKNDLKQHLLIAKDTRQVNMGWFIAGQELPASVIPNNELQSYPNRIVGSLPEGTGAGSDRYNYYNIQMDEDVVRYSAQNTSVLTQGVFYYKAVQGNAVLMKSMYLPDTEREQAIQRTYDKNKLQGMAELDALVHYGIRHNLFKTELTALDKRYPGNNILAACLFELGIITEEEYRKLTHFRLSRYLTEPVVSEDKEFYIGTQEKTQTQTTSENKTKVEGENLESIKNSFKNGSNFNENKNTINYTENTKTLKNEPKMTQNRTKSKVSSQKSLEMPRTLGEALYTSRKLGKYVINSKELSSQNVAEELQKHMIDCSEVSVGLLGGELKKKLYEKSPQYVEIVRRDTWHNVITTASRKLGGRNRITRLEALDNNLFLNKQYIDISNIINTDTFTETEVTSLTDLINFKSLDRELPALCNLTIDSDKLNKASVDLGENAIQKIYTHLPYLRGITIMYPDGESINTHRENIKDTEEIKKRQRKEAVFNNFSKAKKSAKQKKWLNTLGWGTLGTVVGLGSVGLWATKKLYRQFRLLRM